MATSLLKQPTTNNNAILMKLKIMIYRHKSDDFPKYL